MKGLARSLGSMLLSGFNIDIVRIDSESLVLQRRIPSDKGFNIDIVGIGSERRPGAACFGTTEFQYRHCGNR